MEKKAIQNILSSPFVLADWQNLLTAVFGVKNFFQTPAEISLPSSNKADSAYELGSFNTADDRIIGLYLVKLKPEVRVERNKVGLRELLRSVYKYDVDGALVVFEQGDKWRLSFVSEIRTFDNEGNIVEQKTEPKRYTYLLGKDEKTKTPTDRLFAVAGKKLYLKEILEVFSVETLTKEFYNELFDWYKWALSEEIGVTFPNDRSTDADDRHKIEEHIIRLITRLMFVWFIKQKKLVPETIFDTENLKSILKNFDATNDKQDNYYRAILQNLFFATLNNRIEDRAFAADGTFHENKVQYGIKTLYRYADDFSISKEKVVEMFSEVPFLNGGLFECLDKDTPDSNGKIIYCDGFSRKNNKQSRAHIPNILFFDKDKGLIPLLSKYNFTIEENSPNDVEVALDPELLGKVFENLLGTYNPETKETARKQSGSFYTPREIVNYMVDESLIAYLKQAVGEQYEDVFRKLFHEKVEIDAILKKQIYEALRNGKILDPACGSGAFPMGILNRIICMMENIDYSHSIFDLKLHLIENCIYGIDIQSIAVQISKLRFFISLICEQTSTENASDNYGIKPLPNLETKFVAANTLIGLAKKEAQGNLFEDPQIEVTKKSLLEIRHLHFGADTAKKKKEYRTKDKELREKLANLLEANNDFAPEDAKQLALWNPYDQNSSSPFFDTEWMFGLKDGFDIVIGNPPYVSTKGVNIKDKKLLETEYGFADDTYTHFFFKGYKLLATKGSLTYITPKTFWTTQTKRNLRDLLLSKRINYIYDTANPFESAMVDTCIISVQDVNSNNNKIVFIDGSQDLSNPKHYTIEQNIYRNTQNSVIFKPTPENLKIYELYGQKVKELYNQWWDKIKTSRDIEKNKVELEAYRKSLKPGDIALLGCLTEGGQGLATANNGKYIAVRKSTKWAKNILESRPKKLADAIKTYKIEILAMANFHDTFEYLDSLTEPQIVELFDGLKEKYGRDIFGQGYIYRLIDDSEIVDVDTLTEDEKQNGISETKKYYVPYDKGDKDGNRWYLETPFAIAWSQKNVGFLKANSGKKGEGMPVVRNPQFYFKEGFCWTDVNSTYLKARIKKSGVFDVLSMSLFTQVDIPDWYFVCMINSRLISFYVDNFINNTSHFQINDARQLPIIIPSKEKLLKFEVLFNSAVKIKQKQFSNQIFDNGIDNYLAENQNKLDKMVDELYGF